MICVQQIHTLLELDALETLVLRELLTIVRNAEDIALPSEHSRLILELLAKLPR